MLSKELKINLEKRNLVSIGWVENLEVVESKLGCCTRRLPSTCLGLSLNTPFKLMAMWNAKEERF